ncbi:hypothetical protein H0H87_007569 [Tephrocybe sp. NHM501043]|nr:hypothetical protein H0H87_007569 [Tephrocybe sp. NHM501043]
MPTLRDGKYYKIITVISGKVVTLTDDNWVAAFLDRNMETQTFLAQKVRDDTYTLKCMDDSGRYLGYADRNKKGWAIASKEACEWDITQWKTRGWAEYRIWVHGAPSETVLDLRAGNEADGAWIQTSESNSTCPQYWLFTEVPWN